eukprot:1156186-Pelagomonas_calceolata.AAC.5
MRNDSPRYDLQDEEVRMGRWTRMDEDGRGSQDGQMPRLYTRRVRGADTNRHSTKNFVHMHNKAQVYKGP